MASGDDEENSSGGEPETRLRLRPLVPDSKPAFPLAHPYFEVVYGPLLGPTAVLLARAMARHLEAEGGPTTVLPVDVAREVGIRAGTKGVLGNRSRFVRAIDRLAHHRVVVRLDDRVLGVHLVVPPLGPEALERLPPHVLEAHVRFVDGRDD